ncbi:MAG: choice-of-anchor D domain-containing protein, partial [Myxococcota bacterium]
MRRPFQAAIGLFLAVTNGCSCDDSLSALRPRLLVNPEIIDMGRRVVGKSSQADFLVGNEGTAPVSILAYEIDELTTDERVALGGDFVDVTGAAFSVVGGPAAVGAQRSAEGQIAFQPSTRERFGGALVIRSDDLEHPVLRVPLVGEGGPPLIEAEPPSVDFGVVNEGPGASRIVRVKNIGFDTLRVSDLFLVGPRDNLEAAEVGYTLVEGHPTAGSIEAEGSWEVEVRIEPTVAAVSAAGSAELRATLVVLSDAENEPRLEVPLTGQANLAPAAKAVELVTRRSEVKVGFGREVIIDGSETEDPEGDPFLFAWSLVDKPADSSAFLVGNTVAGSCDDDDHCDTASGYRCVTGTCKQVAWTRVTTDAVGTFRVRLRATDARGAYREADAVILPRDLAVVLVWGTALGTSCSPDEDPTSDGCCYESESDACLSLPLAERRVYCCGQTDLDLHLLRPGGVAGDYGQCPAGCTGVVENDLCY